jgi:hypothetical protein
MGPIGNGAADMLGTSQPITCLALAKLPTVH